MNYTYMVKCADGTLYTGWTNCVEKRLKAHNEGKAGAKYNKGRNVRWNLYIMRDMRQKKKQ